MGGMFVVYLYMYLYHVYMHKTHFTSILSVLQSVGWMCITYV